MPFGSELIGGLIAGKPDMPAFDQIDPAQEQTKAISGNQSSLAGIEKLAAGVNTFNQQQIDQMLSSAIPGFQGLKANVSGKIESMVNGELPADVSAAVMRSTAAKGMGLGVGGAGTGMGRNLVARDLGLTSLDLTQKGIDSAQTWMKTVASIEQPGMFNVSSMFLTPEQTMQQDTSERNAKFQHDWNSNMLDWQSSPGYLMNQQIQSDSSMITSMAGSVAGKAAGGGGGGM